MKPFVEIYAQAVARQGGEDVLSANMPSVPPLDDLAVLGDDRCLALMTRCVFQAGFVWRVIEQKWPGFEEAFWEFDIQRVLSATPENRAALTEDTRIVRNGQKIDTVFENARFIAEMSVEHGGFARWLAEWPGDDLIGLFKVLKKRGKRLGGMSGQLFLRFAGKDTFIITGDVVRALQMAGLDIKDQPTSQKDMRTIQTAFNQYRQESGLPYAHISKTLAYAASH